MRDFDKMLRCESNPYMRLDTTDESLWMVGIGYQSMPDDKALKLYNLEDKEQLLARLFPDYVPLSKQANLRGLAKMARAKLMTRP